MKFIFLVIGILGAASAQSNLGAGFPQGDTNSAREALAEAWKKANKGKDAGNDPKLQELLAKMTDGKSMDDLKEKYERENRMRVEKHRQQLLNPPKLQRLEQEYADELLKNPAAQPSADLLQMRKQREYHLNSKSWRRRWNFAKWHTWALILLALTVVTIMTWTGIYICKMQSQKDARTKIKYEKLMANGKMPTENTTFMYDEDDDDGEEIRSKPQDNPNLVRRNKVSLS